MSSIHTLQAQLAFNTNGMANSGFPHHMFNLIANSANWQAPLTYTLGTSPSPLPCFELDADSTNFAAVLIQNTGPNTIQMVVASRTDASENQGTAIDILPGGCFLLFNTLTPGTSPFIPSNPTSLGSWMFSSKTGTTQILVAAAYT